MIHISTWFCFWDYACKLLVVLQNYMKQRSLSAVVAQPKPFPLGVNTTIELENVTTPDNNGI
jgi:hypothetical protein